MVDFNAGKTQLVLFDLSKNTGANDVKMHGSVVGLTLSSKLDWGSCIVYIVETVSKKIGALIGSTKFLSPEVALYLYKSTIPPCMEYCYWFTAASLEPLAHCRNVASLSLSYRYYFGRCSSKLAQLVPLPYF